MHAVQSENTELIYNPRIKAYVDRRSYEDALATQDPTQKKYKGVSPNFGGGLTGDAGIGSTLKGMKKLTTVLSKNQKIASMNPYVNTLKFEVKVNIERALARDVLRKQEALSEAEIEQFRPQLEAALYLLNFPDQSENQLAE